MNITDHQLVLLCQKKDRKAQNFLFEKHKKKVLFICMRYNSNPEDGKDLLQEVFIKIFKSLSSLKEGNEIESLSGWIQKIAIRTAIDQFRIKKKIIYEDIKDDFVISRELTPIENISAQELLDIIQKMPDGYRIIFNLKIIEGYNHTEISKMLNISETTSRSQLTRAKEWLKKRISNNLIDKYGRVFG